MIKRIPIYQSEYMVKIETSIAKGIMRWLDKPENEAYLTELLAQKDGDDSRPMARKLWVAMDAENWIKAQHGLTQPYNTFKISMIRAFRYYKHGYFGGHIVKRVRS